MYYYGDWLDQANYIAHYGVGHLNGGHSGRYPWGSGNRPRQSEALALGVCRKLTDELNTKWDYGVKIGGKRILDTSQVDFSKYRTTPVEKLAKDKIGTCWDFVNYQHAVLKKNGIKDHNYMLVSRMSDVPDDIQTHTFTIADIGGKKHWIESAYWKYRGVHEVKSYKDVIAKVLSDKTKPYDLYEFNPDGMDKGLTDQEYFDRATQNLIETSQKGPYRKIV